MNIGPVSNSNSLATLLQLNSTTSGKFSILDVVSRRGYANTSLATWRVDEQTPTVTATGPGPIQTSRRSTGHQFAAGRTTKRK